MFQASSLPIIRSYSVSMELCSILTPLGSGHQTCIKLTSAEYTVEKS